MLEGSIAFTLSGATNSKSKALFSVWLPDYYSRLSGPHFDNIPKVQCPVTESVAMP